MYEGSTGYENQEMNTYSRFVDWLGRLGTERRWGRNLDANEAYMYGRRRLAVLAAPIALSAVGVAAVAGLSALEQSQNERLESLELCVSEAVGQPIDLQIDPKDGEIIKPETIYDEIVACQRER